MEQSISKRIKRSNDIYPIFSGLSLDLVFFIAVNTLFLTNIKGLTSSQINLSTTISTLVALGIYLISHKIIKKIGNVYSVRLGTLFMLIASILYTVSTKLIFFIIADILYETSFIFKCVNSVILNNNLAYEKKEKEYLKIKFKGTTYYSFVTLFATLIGGVLFSIHPYVPMVISIINCVFVFILSHFIYEVKYDDKKEEIKKKKKFSFNKIVILTIIVYGLIYGTVAVCQTNDKLFMQYELQEFLKGNKVALTLSFILFLSRISRLVSNILFNKIYNKIKEKSLYIVYFILFTSVSLFIFGRLLLPPLYSSIIMAIGFLLLLMLRDPTENILSNILLQNTNKEDKEQAMIYFEFTRSLTVFLLSFLATAVLAKYELIHLYVMIIILIVMYIFVIQKLFSLLKMKNEVGE